MGISGLLPQLKSIAKPTHISTYRGKLVAIDGYSWLHKGAYGCSRELCQGLYTDRFVYYCMQKLDMMISQGVQPYVVFDGGRLPTKAEEEETRSRSRRENREKALAHLHAGNVAAAEECFQRAVSITPNMAKQWIEVLKDRGIRFVVAPYEADAQMAHLALSGEVHAVVTEDSDLLAYGCPRVLYKMDKYGNGEELCIANLPVNTGISLQGFSHDMFLEMCIMAGCDFLPSLPKIGMKTAYQHIKKLKSFTKVCKSLRFAGTTAIPPDYEERFQRALWVFRHQRVFCHTQRKVIHLRPLPPGGLGAANVDVISALPQGEDGQMLKFLGPPLPDDVACGIAAGDLHPETHQPFDLAAIYRGCRNPPRGVQAALQRHNQQHQQAQYQQHQHQQGPASGGAQQQQHCHYQQQQRQHQGAVTLHDLRAMSLSQGPGSGSSQQQPASGAAAAARHSGKRGGSTSSGPSKQRPLPLPPGQNKLPQMFSAMKSRPQGKLHAEFVPPAMTGRPRPEGDKQSGASGARTGDEGEAQEQLEDENVGGANGDGGEDDREACARPAKQPRTSAAGSSPAWMQRLQSAAGGSIAAASAAAGMTQAAGGAGGRSLNPFRRYKQPGVTAAAAAAARAAAGGGEVLPSSQPSSDDDNADGRDDRLPPGARDVDMAGDEEAGRHGQQENCAAAGPPVAAAGDLASGPALALGDITNRVQAQGLQGLDAASGGHAAAAAAGGKKVAGEDVPWQRRHPTQQPAPLPPQQQQEGEQAGASAFSQPLGGDAGWQQAQQRGSGRRAPISALAVLDFPASGSTLMSQGSIGISDCAETGALGGHHSGRAWQPHGHSSGAHARMSGSHHFPAAHPAAQPHIQHPRPAWQEDGVGVDQELSDVAGGQTAGPRHGHFHHQQQQQQVGDTSGGYALSDSSDALDLPPPAATQRQWAAAGARQPPTSGPSGGVPSVRISKFFAPVPKESALAAAGKQAAAGAAAAAARSALKAQAQSAHADRVRQMLARAKDSARLTQQPPASPVATAGRGLQLAWQGQGHGLGHGHEGALGVKGLLRGVDSCTTSSEGGLLPTPLQCVSTSSEEAEYQQQPHRHHAAGPAAAALQQQRRQLGLADEDEEALGLARQVFGEYVVSAGSSFDDDPADDQTRGASVDGGETCSDPVQGQGLQQAHGSQRHPAAQSLLARFRFTAGGAAGGSQRQTGAAEAHRLGPIQDTDQAPNDDDDADGEDLARHGAAALDGLAADDAPMEAGGDVDGGNADAADDDVDGEGSPADFHSVKHVHRFARLAEAAIAKAETHTNAAVAAAAATTDAGAVSTLPGRSAAATAAATPGRRTPGCGKRGRGGSDAGSLRDKLFVAPPRTLGTAAAAGMEAPAATAGRTALPASTSRPTGWPASGNRGASRLSQPFKPPGGSRPGGAGAAAAAAAERSSHMNALRRFAFTRG